MVKPAFVTCSSIVSIVGNRPPGKMSVTMNRMNLAISMVNGMPRSMTCFTCKPVIECSSITPSAGIAL
ncbi:Uncharacterised protein [Mycobacterium tuberculosis]|nr:Uncharacterised protein [Mycobacterium tuberculosis]CNZ51656.1 Uncharacterised protein [Mycobacterium tuberculosis]